MVHAVDRRKERAKQRKKIRDKLKGGPTRRRREGKKNRKNEKRLRSGVLHVTVSNTDKMAPDPSLSTLQTNIKLGWTEPSYLNMK